MTEQSQPTDGDGMAPVGTLTEAGLNGTDPDQAGAIAEADDAPEPAEGDVSEAVASESGDAAADDGTAFLAELTRSMQAAAGAVKTAPLDELIAGTVDFIKIDVEGMELEVLDGAARVIAASRPKIMIEVFRSQIPRFDAWLRQYRYVVRQQFDYVHAVNYLVEPANA